MSSSTLGFCRHDSYISTFITFLVQVLNVNVIPKLQVEVCWYESHWSWELTLCDTWPPSLSNSSHDWRIIGALHVYPDHCYTWNPLIIIVFWLLLLPPLHSQVSDELNIWMTSCWGQTELGIIKLWIMRVSKSREWEREMKSPV